MPRGDGTGPNGFGPMTGRAMGFCAGYASPGFASSRGRGMFYGRGFVRGRGFFGKSFAYFKNEPVVGEEFLKMQKRIQDLEKEIESLRGELTQKEMP